MVGLTPYFEAPTVYQAARMQGTSSRVQTTRNRKPSGSPICALDTTGTPLPKVCPLRLIQKHAPIRFQRVKMSCTIFEAGQSRPWGTFAAFRFMPNQTGTHSRPTSPHRCSLVPSWYAGMLWGAYACFLPAQPPKSSQTAWMPSDLD